MLFSKKNISKRLILKKTILNKNVNLKKKRLQSEPILKKNVFKNNDFEKNDSEKCRFRGKTAIFSNVGSSCSNKIFESLEEYMIPYMFEAQVILK